MLIRFGPFEFDPKAGELRKLGQRVKLQEKPLVVLESLLERAGQLVTREELRKRLWPDDTFVDFDNGLNNAISRVRAALGDSAESPRFIETLGRRGYRFLAPAEPVSAAPGAEERGTRTRHRFGDVSHDVRTRQLWRRGREIHLTRKAFELLVLLIERRPNAISKEEIHARLWPDTFVADATLQSLVSEIRDAIGDPARQARCVRTVHGFGYAFSGDVQDEAAQPPMRRPVRGWLVGEMGRLPLMAGENVVGREGEDVIELASSTVSRRHARITLGKETFVEDLGSKNGTFIGDRPITGRVRLADGNRLRIGSFLLTFRLARAAGETRTRSRSTT